MKEFLRLVWHFLKEIFMFGVDAFMIAAAREIGKRFLNRLREKGGAIAALDEPKPAARLQTQSRLPFLDEYRE